MLTTFTPHTEAEFDQWSAKYDKRIAAQEAAKSLRSPAKRTYALACIKAWWETGRYGSWCGGNRGSLSVMQGQSVELFLEKLLN